MKNVVKLSLVLSLAFALAMSPLVSFASYNTEKVVERARAAVKNAADDDWKTLAKSATICIRKGINMQEALSWVNKSIAIDKNVENLELLGDYYFKFGNNRQAMISYIEVIKFGKANNVNYDSTLIEEKIAKARK